ncbi:recombinase family protein [Bacillus tropicus]|uniref:recombinase family protein n=1 Tax=Bacillus tropicus TaxID=2026188 RepID=UPI003EDA0040
MRYAVYVRVSTDHDDQVSSVENQIDICRYWIERNGFEWDENAVYFDDGISGTAWLERHAMQLILERARKKEIETVIFKSIHRLARDLKDALEIKEILLGHGIRLVTIEEGYDSLYEGRNDMKFEMYAMFASQLPKTLSVSISAALTAKVRRGEHIGGRAPYGYDVIDKKLVINENEASVVRRIYDLYENGFGYVKIATKLNDEGKKTKAGGYWRHSAVQKIIRSAVYKGDFIMNQHTKVKVAGRKKHIRNPKEKWNIFKNHHPAIIDPERWNIINDPNRDNSKKRRAALKNELRGLVYCAHCGSTMRAMRSGRITLKDGTNTEFVYMKCSRYKDSGTRECVKHEPLSYDNLREFIIQKLKQKEFDLEMESDLQNKNLYEEKLGKLKKEIRQITSKKERLVDLYMDELIDKSTFVERERKLDAVIREKETELLELSDIEEQEKKKKEVKATFGLIARSNDLYEAFKLLISRIEVTKDGVVNIFYRFEY